MGHMSLGREGKAHDRRTLRGNLAKANPFAKVDAPPPLIHSPAAPPLSALPRPGALFDAAAFLLSRALSRDQERMLARARDAGVAGVIVLTTDAEKSAEMSALVKAHAGFLYSAAGVHPDNVKKGLSDKAAEALLADVRAAAMAPECVAIFCGLDHSRDIASHFAQEKLLDAHLSLAADVRLPVLIHIVGDAADAVADKLAAWVLSVAAEEVSDDGQTSIPFKPRAVVLGFDGNEKSLKALLAAGASVAFSGALCAVGEGGDGLRSLFASTPIDRLLLASLSPLHTPATIADDFVRAARNEPSNMTHLIPTMVAARVASGSDIVPLDALALSDILFENATRFFLGAWNNAGVAGAAGAGTGGGVSATGDATIDEAAEEGKEEDIAGVAQEPTSTTGSSSAADAAAAGGGGAADASASAEASAVQHTVFRCKACRAVLFDEGDVMPHSSSGLAPSARAARVGAAAIAAPPGKSKSGASPASVIALVASATAEVGVGKWTQAKGKAVIVSASEGACRAHLIERMGWMMTPAGEPEGSLTCPGCATKVGQYSLSGLKCSCGLLITPAFKIPKQRVDAVREGASALEYALRSAELAERGLGGEDDYGGDGRDGDVTGGKREKKKGMSKMERGHNKGNFSEFRNKNTMPRAIVYRKVGEKEATDAEFN